MGEEKEEVPEKEEKEEVPEEEEVPEKEEEEEKVLEETPKELLEKPLEISIEKAEEAENLIQVIRREKVLNSWEENTNLISLQVKHSVPKNVNLTLLPLSKNALKELFKIVEHAHSLEVQKIKTPMNYVKWYVMLLIKKKLVNSIHSLMLNKKLSTKDYLVNSEEFSSKNILKDKNIFS